MAGLDVDLQGTFHVISVRADEYIITIATNADG